MPVSKGLTRQFPIALGCTIEELILIAGLTIGSVIALDVLLGISMVAMFHVSAMKFARYSLPPMALICYLLVRYVTAPSFARRKIGKPPNFWKIELAAKFQWYGKQIKRKGVWNTRKRTVK